MDERLGERLTSQEDVGVLIERMDDALRTTRTETFKYQTSLKKIIQKANQSLGGRQLSR